MDVEWYDLSFDQLLPWFFSLSWWQQLIAGYVAFCALLLALSIIDLIRGTRRGRPHRGDPHGPRHWNTPPLAHRVVSRWELAQERKEKEKKKAAKKAKKQAKKKKQEQNEHEQNEHEQNKVKTGVGAGDEVGLNREAPWET